MTTNHQKSLGLIIISAIMLALIISFFIFNSKKYDNTSSKRIFIIHSYEPNYPSYSFTEDLIKKKFKESGEKVEVRTFYLNCEKYIEREENSLMKKALDSITPWKPNLILVFDDQATYTLMSCKHPLVKQLPILFSGVNYPNWKLLNNYPNITGLQDSISYSAYFKLIKDIFGYCYVNVWLDRTYLGRKATRQLLVEMRKLNIREFGGTAYSLGPNETFNINDTTRFNYGKEDFDNFHVNPVLTRGLVRAENFFNETTSNDVPSVFMECIRNFVTNNLAYYSASPTFSVINEGFGFKSGIVGGYFTPLTIQIDNLVKDAVGVLHGTQIKDLPIRVTPKKYMIDWREARRWRIPKSAIPNYCQIINMPITERYKTIFIFIYALLGALVISITFFIWYLYKKENKNKNLVQKELGQNERFLSLALGGDNVFAFKIDEKKMFLFDYDFYAITGQEQHTIPFDKFLEYIYPNDRPRFIFKKERIDKSLNNSIQCRCCFKDKQYRWWEFRYSFNEEDKTYSGLCLNIQRSKRTEEELILARKSAEESDRLKSTFIANMSHEIRTPLNAIVGFSNLIVSDESIMSDNEKDNFLKLINTNCDLLLKLINDILDLSRYESGQAPLVIDSFNLNEFISDIYETTKNRIPQEIDFLKELPEVPLRIETDQHMLTQLINNLISNSIKFTNKGFIKIGYNYEDKYVNIFVEDSGVGIPEANQQTIFDRFNKLNQFAQGTGLGLAICKIIAIQLGAQIKLNSEEGSGSCFTIILPFKTTQL